MVGRETGSEPEAHVHLHQGVHVRRHDAEVVKENTAEIVQHDGSGRRKREGIRETRKGRFALALTTALSLRFWVSSTHPVPEVSNDLHASEISR